MLLSEASLPLEKLFGPRSSITIALSTGRQGQGEFSDDPGRAGLEARRPEAMLQVQQLWQIVAAT